MIDGTLLPDSAARRTSVHGEVLIVDDDAQIRALLKMALHLRGYYARLACSGREALYLFNRHRDRIRVVVLDIDLGEMSGTETLRALQTIDPDVRACFMSAGLGNEQPESLLKRGALRVFPKPFPVDEICRFIESVATNGTGGEQIGAS